MTRPADHGAPAAGPPTAGASLELEEALRRARELLATVTYKPGWRFEASGEGDEVALHADYEAVDAEDISATVVVRVSSRVRPVEVLEARPAHFAWLVERLVIRAEEHERRDWLRLAGSHVTPPHEPPPPRRPSPGRRAPETEAEEACLRALEGGEADLAEVLARTDLTTWRARGALERLRGRRKVVRRRVPRSEGGGRSFHAWRLLRRHG